MVFTRCHAFAVQPFAKRQVSGLFGSDSTLLIVIEWNVGLYVPLNRVVVEDWLDSIHFFLLDHIIVVATLLVVRVCQRWHVVEFHVFYLTRIPTVLVSEFVLLTPTRGTLILRAPERDRLLLARLVVLRVTCLHLLDEFGVQLRAVAEHVGHSFVLHHLLLGLPLLPLLLVNTDPLVFLLLFHITVHLLPLLKCK